MSTCLISIGSNQGDPVTQITTSLDLLGQHRHIDVNAVSTLRESKPVGGPPGQEEFLNAAVRVDTHLSPQSLLGELQRIEDRLGRTRETRWGSRIIDLDLLLYDDLVLRTEELEVPHPRMAFRRFVVEPANEIASDMFHPRIGWPISQIATHLETGCDYIALTGISETGKTAIARSVADRVPVNILLSDVSGSDVLGHEPAKIVAEEKVILDRRVEMLKTIPRARSRDMATFTLSDFWFEQSAAYVKCSLAPEFQAEPLLALDALVPVVPRPKLLVVLENPVASEDRSELEEARSFDRTSQLQMRIVERSQIPNRGPTLWLDAQDPAWAVEEIVAAIEAMQ